MESTRATFSFLGQCMAMLLQTSAERGQHRPHFSPNTYDARESRMLFVFGACDHRICPRLYNRLFIVWCLQFFERLVKIFLCYDPVVVEKMKSAVAVPFPEFTERTACAWKRCLTCSTFICPCVFNSKHIHASLVCFAKPNKAVFPRYSMNGIKKIILQCVQKNTGHDLTTTS